PMRTQQTEHVTTIIGGRDYGVLRLREESRPQPKHLGNPEVRKRLGESARQPRRPGSGEAVTGIEMMQGVLLEPHAQTCPSGAYAVQLRKRECRVHQALSVMRPRSRPATQTAETPCRSTAVTFVSSATRRYN